MAGNYRCQMSESIIDRGMVREYGGNVGVDDNKIASFGQTLDILAPDSGRKIIFITHIAIIFCFCHSAGPPWQLPCGH